MGKKETTEIGSCKSFLVNLMFFCSSHHGAVPYYCLLFLFSFVSASEMSVPPLPQTKSSDEADKASLLVLVLTQKQSRGGIS